MGRLLMDEDSNDPWLLVADGGLRGHRGGIGLVLARGFGVVEVRGFSMRIHNGNSTALEWLVKAEILSLTAQLRGRKILVADSAAGAFQGGKLPDFGTWLTKAQGRGRFLGGAVAPPPCYKR